MSRKSRSLSRRRLLLLTTTGLTAPATLPGSRDSLPGAGRNHAPAATPHPRLDLRMGVEILRNPYWYAAHGFPEDARRFWDRKEWDRLFRGWAREGYTVVLYWVEPWQEHAWQTFLIRHRAFPEARELTPEPADRVIEQVRWVFHRARELGLMNFLFTYFIVTTPAFAGAHGLARPLPASATVDFRHNLKEMGALFGVRNELTRAFTEAAIAELFHTYDDLDGLYGGMGEAVPGKRSTWYREAVVPGLKRSGRNPIFLVSNWMLPLEDFMADIAPREVYGNTWLALHANGEMFTDPALYPAYLRWTESARLPTVIEIMHHNLEAGFPFNSPRLASEIIRTYRRVENCRGYLAWFTQSDPNSLFRSALAYYSRNDAPYSDQPWIDRLEARFGDREAAGHFLRAYDASARIASEVSALAWCPHDLSISRQLMLPYWYWTEQDPRWSEFASPARSGVLLPVRHYAAVVARMGPTFRDNSGTDYARNREHPGAQELIWGLGDYPVTPEAHMRNVQRLGETSMKEAEAALATVRRREDEARALADWMKAYQLLTDYYESKVLAAVSALVYSFNKAPEDRADAERLADEAVERYERAIQFIWEKIDKKTGRMKARWLGGQVFTLPQLIENERRERRQLGQLFHWPTDTS